MLRSTKWKKINNSLKHLKQYAWSRSHCFSLRITHTCQQIKKINALNSFQINLILRSAMFRSCFACSQIAFICYILCSHSRKPTIYCNLYSHFSFKIMYTFFVHLQYWWGEYVFFFSSSKHTVHEMASEIVRQRNVNAENQLEVTKQKCVYSFHLKGEREKKTKQISIDKTNLIREINDVNFHRFVSFVLLFLQCLCCLSSVYSIYFSSK